MMRLLSFRPSFRAGDPTRGVDAGTSAHISDRIRLARVACIFFMCMVHTITAGEMFPEGGTSLVKTLLHGFFTDILGRSSVPLLSIVSGYLMYCTARDLAWWPLAWRRTKALLLPMVTWNLSSLLLAFTITAVGFTAFHAEAFQAGDLWHRMNAIFALTTAPANYPLLFLRDLFLCSLAFPLVLLAARRAPWLLLGGLAVAAYFDLWPPLILRSNIPFFFSLGVVIAIRGSIVAVVDRVPRMIFGLFLLVTAIILAAKIPDLPLGLRDHLQHVAALIDGISLLKRLICAAFIWSLVGWILQTPVLAPVSAWMFRQEKWVYLAFLSHVPLFIVIGKLWHRFIGYDSPLTFYLYLASPFIAFFVAGLLWRLLSRLPKPVSLIMMGKATSRRPETARAASVATPTNS